MLTLLARFLKALNSETGAWALAFAFVLGMIMGFTPLFRVHNAAILLIALLFRINLSGFLVSWMICSGIAYLLDPWFHSIGSAVLQADSWQPVWQGMYESAWWRVLQYHHSITMGSVIVSLCFAPILALTSYFLVTQYRQRVQKWFFKLRLVQALRANKFWAIYADLRG